MGHRADSCPSARTLSPGGTAARRHGGTAARRHDGRGEAAGVPPEGDRPGDGPEQVGHGQGGPQPGQSGRVGDRTDTAARIRNHTAVDTSQARPGALEPDEPPSSGTAATATAQTPPTANAGHIPPRASGSSSSGSSRYGATKGITPRSAPATVAVAVAVAGLKTATVTPNAARETVAWRPRSAVSTSETAAAASVDTYSGSAAPEMVVDAPRALTPASPAPSHGSRQGRSRAQSGSWSPALASRPAVSDGFRAESACGPGGCRGGARKGRPGVRPALSSGGGRYCPPWSSSPASSRPAAAPTIRGSGLPTTSSSLSA